MRSVIQKLFHGGTIETSISESRIYNTLYVCMRARTRRIYIYISLVYTSQSHLGLIAKEYNYGLPTLCVTLRR